MNDDTLTHAFNRMASAVAPPAAADELVAGSRARLRRRRRLTTGLVATSVLAIAATGGAVASTMGTAGPNPTPAASSDAAPASAETNSAPTCTPGGDRIWTLKELQSLSHEVPEAGALLSLDLEGNPPRVWVLEPDGGGAVLELLLKKKGEQFEIAAATPCTD